MVKFKGSAQAVYNASGQTLIDGQETGLFLNASGALLVTLGGSSSVLQVEGAYADNAATSAKPLLGGSKYNATLPTYDDGDVSNFQADVNGRQIVNIGTLFAGEDLTNNVLGTQ